MRELTELFASAVRLRSVARRERAKWIIDQLGPALSMERVRELREVSKMLDGLAVDLEAILSDRIRKGAFRCS